MLKQPTAEQRSMDVNESFLASEKKHIDMLNESLGDIKLTKEEEKCLIWLCGNDTFTVANIISAFEKARKQT